MSDFITRTCVECSGDGQYQPPNSAYRDGDWDLTCTACGGKGKVRVRVKKTLDVDQWAVLEKYLLEQHRNTFLDLLGRNTSAHQYAFARAREACLAAAIPEERLLYRERNLKQRREEARGPIPQMTELYLESLR